MQENSTNPPSQSFMSDLLSQECFILSSFSEKVKTILGYFFNFQYAFLVTDAVYSVFWAA